MFYRFDPCRRTIPITIPVLNPDRTNPHQIQYVSDLHSNNRRGSSLLLPAGALDMLYYLFLRTQWLSGVQYVFPFDLNKQERFFVHKWLDAAMSVVNRDWTCDHVSNGFYQDNLQQIVITFEDDCADLVLESNGSVLVSESDYCADLVLESNEAQK